MGTQKNINNMDDYPKYRRLSPKKHQQKTLVSPLLITNNLDDFNLRLHRKQLRRLQAVGVETWGPVLVLAKYG